MNFNCYRVGAAQQSLWWVRLSVGLLVVAIIPSLSASDALLLRAFELAGGRDHAEYHPVGLRMGSLQLFPKVVFQAGWDNNLFASNTDQISDQFWTIKPGFRLQSRQDGYSFDFDANAILGRYQNHESEDYDDYTFSLRSRIRLSHASDISFSMRHAILHQDRRSIEAENGLSPTEYDLTSVGLQYRRWGGRFSVQWDGGLARADYNDVPTLLGTINNDDRDRDDRSTTLRLGYQFASNREIFLKTKYDQRDYELALDDNGLGRDSVGYGLALGMLKDVPGMFRIQAFVGAERRNYEDERLDDHTNLWLGGRLDWNVSGVTSVSMFTNRKFEDTTLANSSGYSATQVGIALDHEIMKNLVVHLELSAQNNDYEKIERNDDLFQVNVEAEYAINRRSKLVLQNRWRSRDSNEDSIANGDYDNNAVSLQLQLQL